MDLVSVIIPVFNVEKYLHRCIYSVLNQSYKNIEIILINDGSQDKSGEICDSFLKIDERVKVIHKENGGLSDARNIGIDASSGKYITFLDSDDWIHEDFIQRLYRILIETNTDISIANYYKISERDLNKPIKKYEPKLNIFTNIEALEQLTTNLYIQFVIACCKIYKKDLFIDIRFPKGKIHEDEFTTYKLLYKANGVSYTSEKLLYYWQHSESIMGKGFNLTQRLSILDAYIERSDFYNQRALFSLRDKTYRTTFFIYVDLIVQVIKNPKKYNHFSHYIDLESIKKKLESSNQTILFKSYCKLFFMNPILFAYLYYYYVKIRRLIESF